MDVLKRISDLMEEQELTSYALAKKSNLSNSTIRNIFIRNTVPSVNTIENICNSLGITLSQFFSEDLDMVCLNEIDKELLKHWAMLTQVQKEAFLAAIKSV